MLRQRLVGTLVLLCGGVILWSLLFTSPAEYKLDRSSQIPTAPRIDPVLNHDPQIPDRIANADDSLVPPQPVLPPQDVEPVEQPVLESEVAPEPTSVEREKAVSTKPPAVLAEPVKPKPEPVKPEPVKPRPAPAVAEKTTSPTLDKSGLPTSWVVQVGSFGQSTNAESLKDKLQARGHKAFVDKRSYSGRQLYRVLVGPMLAKDLAEKESAQINSQFGVKSIVTRFED